MEADGGGLPFRKGKGNWRVELECAVPRALEEDVDCHASCEPGRP